MTSHPPFQVNFLCRQSSYDPIKEGRIASSLLTYATLTYLHSAKHPENLECRISVDASGTSHCRFVRRSASSNVARSSTARTLLRILAIALIFSLPVPFGLRLWITCLSCVTSILVETVASANRRA